MGENLKEPRFNGLTVVSIVLLAALLLVVGIGISSNAEKRNLVPIHTATSLESAVNNFHIEYGVLPAVGSHVRTDGPDGVRFLNILLGREDDSTQKENPGNIKFLAVREAKSRENGLYHDEVANRVEGLYDLWGNPYIMEINVKNEDKLRFTFGERMIELPGRLVTAYSPGKDGKSGTAADVKTW